MPNKKTGICYLCLNEKLFIIEHQGNNLLTKEMNLSLSVDTKCKQIQAYELQNLTTVWKVSVLGAFFWCIFFHTFGLNKEPYRVSPHIHSECGIMWGRPTPNANTFHAVDV